MSISSSHRYFSRLFMIIISMGVLLSMNGVYAKTSETGAPVEFTVQQERQISRTLVSRVAPPEISSALIERSASSQITNQFDGPVQPLAGPVDLLADGFEGAFPGAWLLFDNDGATNGEIYWDATSFRSLAGSNSAWCAGGGPDAIADGSPYANNMNSWMVAGPYDLTDASSGFWQFDYWIKSESGADNFLFLVSTDGVSFNGYQSSGNSLGWVSGSIDFVSDPGIGNITGNPNVYFAFIFLSDADTTDEGVYVDEVLIQKTTSDGVADLSLQTIDAQNGVYLPGDETVIYTDIENIGDGASAAYTATYYLSTDETITAGDQSLGFVNLPALGAGASQVFNLVGATIPGDTTDGDYYIGAILDLDDADANNNVNHDPVPITVSTEPDIEIIPLSLDFEGSVHSGSASEAQKEQAFDVVQFNKESLALLTDRVNRSGKVDLIVGLNMPTHLEGKLTSAQSQQQQANIQTRGQQLITQLNGMNNQIRRQFQFIPYIAIRADLETLEYLGTSPLVASITEDKISRVNMASSNAVIGSPVAWAEGYDGTDWAVAVLDTGVDNTHSWFTTGGSKVVSEGCYGTNIMDVVESLCPGFATSSTDPDSGLNCDPAIAGCDHGTHVAGTVAGNDGAGPDFGVAREADIIAMKVFSKFLTEENCGAGQAPCVLSFSSDQIAAMEQVLLLADTIDIAAINMSLGGGQYFNQATCDADNGAVKAAIDNLRSVGIAAVISSGNNGWTDSIGSPGCISTAISVGATTDSDDVAVFSNMYPQIHLLAPGVDITSSVPGEALGVKQGTSMSAPHVAGAWAVMKHLDPLATVDEVLANLQATGVPVSDLRPGGVEVDTPRINLEAAIGNQRTTFAIYNNGPEVLSVTSIVPETPAAWISWLPEAPFDVPAGGVQIVSITIDYSQAPLGLSETRLLVSSNDPDESPYPGGVMINVTKIESTEPEYSSFPEAGATLAFGDVVIVTSSSPQVVDVENLGAVDLTLSCIITGANADQFDIAACPSPVASAGAVEISVTCDPLSIGAKLATLEVTTNDTDEGEVSYILTCNGIELPDEGLIFSDGFEGEAPPTAPDLLVINPGVDDSSLSPSQPFTIDATAMNQGNQAADASTLRYFLSVDDVIANDDLSLGTDAVPSLAPASNSAQDLLTVAPEADGTYWVGACVDAVAGEINIANQCSTSVEITVLTLSGTAVASFTPSEYTREQPVAVSITATPDTGVSSYEVEDTVPVDWVVSAISHSGVFDGPDNAVKWGPFPDDSARALSYTATPPVSSYGTKAFIGEASFDGNVIVITGDRQMDDADPPADTDGDRLPDSVETNTGTFVDENDTGTDPNVADTDADGISDGDEVLGTLAGLDLPAMGVSPLRKDLLLEYDWFDDSADCGAHSHRPSVAAISSVTTAFDISPEPNPDGSNGVNLISDYGQGGAFSGGNFINDADGVIAGGVSGTDFLNYKAANFAGNRNGYFHYVLLPHRYNTNSGSSGQAEVAGDDMIVSLQCFDSTSNVANTIMHEVGHNLFLLHGGDNSCNWKPNYNSVMNYKYQFPGIDNNCTPDPDGVLSYSIGDRIDLNENNLNENNGTCGPGNPFDWNGNTSIEASISHDINTYDGQVGSCGGTLTTLQDNDDWGGLYFLGIGDSDGQSVVPVEIITEQPVPAAYRSRND